jgi:glutamine amidotransferase
VVVVVDTQRGNLLSMCNALYYLGAKFRVAEKPEEISGAQRLIVPGVGSFKTGMERLRAQAMIEPLEEVRRSGAPILGVCLGMQFMARRSYEGGETEGLGWIQGDVIRLAPQDLRVPHVGWNEITIRRHSPLFAGIDGSPDFYFFHSFHFVADATDVVDATCEYGHTVTAAARAENVAGVQFHPEKSQDVGLALLENFLRWQP